MKLISALRYLIFLLFSVTLLAFCLEGVLYLIYKNPPLEVIRLAAQKYYMEKERDIIQYNQNCAQYDKSLGYRMKPPGCEFKNREFKTQIEVNSLGVRDNEDSLDAPEIIVIGDSFGFGWGVESDRMFSSLIEKAIGKKVLNLSIPSYGTARELKILGEADTRNLKYLIIQFCSNDQDENIAFVNSKGHLDVMSQEKYMEVIKQNPSRDGYLFGDFSKYFLRNVFEQISAKPVIENKQPAIDRARVFIQALKLSPIELSGLKKIIVLNAEPFHLMDKYFSNVLTEEISKDDNFSLKKKIKVLDIYAHLTLNDFFVLEDHWNESGHRKVSELITVEIQ